MQTIAVIACLLASVLGASALITHSSTPQSVVGYVADVWMLASLIVNKAYTREYWALINRPIRDIVKNPPATTRIVQTVTFGMIALLILQTALWFV